MKNILVYFTTYSGDNYYIVLSEENVKNLNAKEFCERYLPVEYSCWINRTFKYQRFKCYKINEDGSCNIPYEPGIGISSPFQIREQDIIDTLKMEKGKLYSPDTLMRNNAYIACDEKY